MQQAETWERIKRCLSDDLGIFIDNQLAEFERVSALWNEARMSKPEETAQWGRVRNDLRQQLTAAEERATLADQMAALLRKWRAGDISISMSDLDQPLMPEAAAWLAAYDGSHSQSREAQK